MAGSGRSRSKIERRNRLLRDSLWPDAESRIWHYQKSDGWLNIPRAMPAILRTMDSLTKGQPVSSTYFDLWCRTYNNGFVTASKPGEMAFFSGFDGERAQRTWISRVRKLQELGFIDIKEGPSGPVSYILIENPYTALKKLSDKGLIQARMWNALIARMIEIGADDFELLSGENDEKDGGQVEAGSVTRGRKARIKREPRR
ncbi:hypothetical protein [Minwuia thermotolerans]|uniref:hypothetical protein n=1 Tax=Minwuia thermotolerans TaxID=2056226 RepID=UPI000F63C86F|nr:hypothetical protein [Minwuia thermotolerans]